MLDQVTTFDIPAEVLQSGQVQRTSIKCAVPSTPDRADGLDKLPSRPEFVRFPRGRPALRRANSDLPAKV